MIAGYSNSPQDRNQQLAETRNRIATMTPAELTRIAMLLSHVTAKVDRDLYVTQQLALLRLRALRREGRL